MTDFGRTKSREHSIDGRAQEGTKEVRVRVCAGPGNSSERQQGELRQDPSSITMLLEIGGIVMTELQERMVMPFAYHM